METNRGKIGRLPEAIREKLNERLAAGEPAGPLLEWLNALPQVRAVLAAQFGGSPLTESNLSRWHLGGYVRWCQKRERRSAVQELAADIGDLEANPEIAAVNADLSKCISRVFTADFAAAAREVLDGITEPVERCTRLQGFLRTLTHLRREECQAARLKIAQERRAHEAAREEREEEMRREDAIVGRQMQMGQAADLFASPDFNKQMLAVDWQRKRCGPKHTINRRPGREQFALNRT